MRTRRRSMAFYGWMLVFTALALLFLALIGRAALQDQDLFQFYADSITYHRVYEGDLDLSSGTLIGVASNYVGPMLVLNLAGGSAYIVALLNILVFTLSVDSISKTMGLDAPKFAGLLMLSPLTVSSLLSVNKEVFFFPFLALALVAYTRRSTLAMILAILVSILFRWQLLIFYLVLLALIHGPKLVKRRSMVIALLLVAISAIYVMTLDWLAPVLAVSEASIADFDGGSGLFEATLNYQKEGLYFLVFPVRALHLLFGMGLRFGPMFSPEDIYNDLFVAIHCLVSLIMFGLVLKRGQLSLRSDIVFSAIVFTALMSVSPIFAPRYLYPVFVVLVLTLAGAPTVLPRARSRPRKIRIQLFPDRHRARS